MEQKVLILNSNGTAEVYKIINQPSGSGFETTDMWGWQSIGEPEDEEEDEAPVNLDNIFTEDDEYKPERPDTEAFDRQYFGSDEEYDAFVCESCSSCRVKNCPANENQI